MRGRKKQRKKSLKKERRKKDDSMVHTLQGKKNQMITVRAEDGKLVYEFWRKLAEVSKPKNGSLAPSAIIRRDDYGS